MMHLYHNYLTVAMQNNFLFVLFCFIFLFFYLKIFFFVAKRDNFGVGGGKKKAR